MALIPGLIATSQEEQRNRDQSSGGRVSVRTCCVLGNKIVQCWLHFAIHGLLTLFLADRYMLHTRSGRSPGMSASAGLVMVGLG